MRGRVLAMPDNRRAEAVAIAVNSGRQGLTDAVLRACQRLGLTEKELAALLKVGQAQFSRQKANKDGHYLQVQRFDVLPADFHALFLDALIEELALLRGKTVVQPHGHLAHIARAMRSMSDAVDSLAASQPQAALPFEAPRKLERGA